MSNEWRKHGHNLFRHNEFCAMALLHRRIAYVVPVGIVPMYLRWRRC